ncbi:FhaA domain-containing protein [Haloglycomyces albus]|uniref:FhaA domain-containing protein n=1 Tax=Haloglycomyces albus TaxID=526067 RepID=UPI00046D436C|nr:DUF3662 and FHA domain-containing protein [Haloglycomyces albus]
MSVLQRLERQLEGLFEGTFNKMFKGVVHPVEIASAMQREAESHKAVLAGDRVLVPNRYVIDLSPPDHDRLAPYAAALAQELAQSQAEFIGENGWTVYGDVIVEIERGEGLDSGMFRVTAEVAALNEGAEQEPPGGMGGGYGGQPAAPSGPILAAGDGRQFSVAHGSTVIGRGEQAQIRLPDVGISRQHARVDFDGRQVSVTDLGSTNGTLVNGQRITTVSIQPGDVVQLGTTSLTLQVA